MPLICIHEDEITGKCTTSASFNYSSEKVKLYCSVHRKKGMVNVTVKRCIYEDEINGKCDIIPSFNYDGEKRGLYCKLHKLENL